MAPEFPIADWIEVIRVFTWKLHDQTMTTDMICFSLKNYCRERHFLSGYKNTGVMESRVGV